jgi:hypothetical protein
MAEWDNAHLLDKGQDLTPSFGALASAIEQAIEQATTASWYGPIIYSEDTPPVTGAYVFNKRGLWQKISTKRWYYYNTTAGSWDNLENVLVLVIPDGSVTLAKLSVTGADPLEVLRRNAAGTAFEWATASSLIVANSIALDRLVNAVGAGYHLLSDGSGIYLSTLFSSSWATQYANATKTVQDLVDGSTTGVIGQVLSLEATSTPGDPGPVILAWADQLLRTNQVLTNKLQFAAGAAGKYAKVNAGGTDFEYDTGPTVIAPTVATLVDTGVSGTAPQSVLAITLTTVRLAAETAQSWCTVSSSQFTLAVGTYQVYVAVPITLSTTTSKAYISLSTGSTKIKTANVNFSDNDTPVGIIMAVLVVTVATQYKIEIYCDNACTLGTANSFASIPEVYSQVMITKLS